MEGGASEEGGVEWDFLGPDKKLGIDIGKELMNLTKEEASDLRREGTEIIERAFASKFITSLRTPNSPVNRPNLPRWQIKIWLAED